MMTTEALEEAIIGRLEDKESGLAKDTAAVGKLPNDIDGYFPKHPAGEVLVQYQRSTFSEPRALNAITQERRMRFAAFVMTRNLHDNKGAKAVMDAVRKSLTGFQPAGAGKIYPVSEEFLSEQSGIWTYRMIFALDATHEEIQAA